MSIHDRRSSSSWSRGVVQCELRIEELSETVTALEQALALTGQTRSGSNEGIARDTDSLVKAMQSCNEESAALPIQARAANAVLWNVLALADPVKQLDMDLVRVESLVKGDASAGTTLPSNAGMTAESLALLLDAVERALDNVDGRLSVMTDEVTALASLQRGV